MNVQEKCFAPRYEIKNNDLTFLNINFKNKPDLKLLLKKKILIFIRILRTYLPIFKISNLQTREKVVEKISVVR